MDVEMPTNTAPVDLNMGANHSHHRHALIQADGHRSQETKNFQGREICTLARDGQHLINKITNNSSSIGSFKTDHLSGDVTMLKQTTNSLKQQTAPAITTSGAATIKEQQTQVAPTLSGHTKTMMHKINGLVNGVSANSTGSNSNKGHAMGGNKSGKSNWCAGANSNGCQRISAKTEQRNNCGEKAIVTSRKNLTSTLIITSTSPPVNEPNERRKPITTTMTTTTRGEGENAPAKQSSLAQDRRRNSLENGDVFIYPPIYRRLNECRKCSRDNKICNCNLLSGENTESDEDGLKETTVTESEAATARAKREPQLAQTQTVGRICAPGKCANQALVGRPQVQPRQQKAGQVQAQVSGARQGGEQETAGPLTKATDRLDGVIGGQSESSGCSSCGSSTRSNGSSGDKTNEGSERARLAHYLAGDNQARQISEPTITRAAKVTAITIGAATTAPNPFQRKQKINANAETTATNDCNNNETLESRGLSLKGLTSRESITAICIGATATTTAPTTSTSTTTPALAVDNNLSSSSESDSASSLTSVVPIHSVSARRKNLASKLSRQAIYEDYDEEHDEPLGTRGGESPAPGSGALSMELALVAQVNNPQSSAIEYSPILSSARDYIQNVNPGLQFDGATLSPGLGPEADAMVQDIEIPLSLAQSVIAIGTENLATTSTTVAKIVDQLESVEAPIAGEPGNLISSIVGKGALLVHKDALESPKKSIFEGASKDEILEYLEDARERVPEVLIAADDVMVIGENELIVVNQLDPNSPATPISIVAASEVIDHRHHAATTTATTNGGASVALVETDARVEGLRAGSAIDRLAVLRYNSSVTSSATLDEDTGDANSSSIDIGPNCATENSSFEAPTSNSNNDNNAPASVCSSANANSNLDQRQLIDHRLQMKNYSFATETTIDSLEDCQVTAMDNICSLNSDSLLVQAGDLRAKGPNSGGGGAGQVLGEPVQPGQQQQQQLSWQLSGGAQLGPRSRKEELSLANIISRSLVESSGSPERFAFKLQRSLNCGPGRRNSTSGGASALDRDRTLQRMLMGGDSLSLSSSSSPPSSTSPSSSSNSSSNRTSGECSATSNFYASSSLSCSSPFIAANRMSPSSPAFGRPTTPARNVAAITAQASYEPNDTTAPNAIGSASDPRTPTSCLLAAGGCVQQLGPASLSQVERADSGFGSEAARKQQEPEAAKQAAMSLNQFLLAQAAESDTELGSGAKGVQQEDLAIIGNCLDILADQSRGVAGEQALEKTVGLLNLGIANLIGAKQSNGQVSRQPIRLGSGAGGLLSRSSHVHQATMNRLNNYFISRQPLTGAKSAGALVDATGTSAPAPDVSVEYQCLDCDQFIYADQAALMQKSNEIRQMRANDIHLELDAYDQSKPLTAKQLDRAYIAAMNGLPLCKSCDKKRIERKEIISEFVETELKYGRDLKIIHDEFYRPMQIAGLLSKDQINGIFLNLEELIMAHCRFYDRLEGAVSEAHSMGDQDYNTVNIGKIFVESAEMLHTFESYCIRQGSAACLLARLAKEKELLRIFLRVSQMENTLLRRMNLAAFLMVPVQRVTKYPLLLNRLYKVTAYHHKDREALRDAQLKVELHLEHINQQTKGVGATNKIWRRISNLSAPISNRRGLINAEDIGYIKLRKTAMDMLKWDRDETQFIHSGKVNFAPLNEYLIKQRMKPIRYMAAHALLIVLGKPNWKYRPDMVKSSLDNKLMVPTLGGNGIKEAALLLFREKNNRFVPCREPLFLSNCVVSNDCSQFNNENCPNQTAHHHNNHHGGSGANNSTSQKAANQVAAVQTLSGCGSNLARRSISGSSDSRESVASEFRPASAGECQLLMQHQSVFDSGPSKSLINTNSVEANEQKMSADNVSMSSLKSLPENQSIGAQTDSPPVIQPPRSFSLASALPRTPISTGSSVAHLTKSTSTTSSNLTILNHLMTKVNNYHHHKHSSTSQSSLSSTFAHPKGEQMKTRVASPMPSQSTSIEISNHLLDSQVHHSGSIHSSQSIDSSSSLRSNSISQVNISAGSSNDTGHVHYFFHNHHQPYGDYEESFEIHECLTKESMLLRADTPLKTRYWLQILRYHAKDLGHWRSRRNALPNIMMMRHE